VNGWPLNFFGGQNIYETFPLGTANKTDAFGFALPYQLNFSKSAFYVDTTDIINNYDIGIYTKAGLLIADIGAQTLPGSGVQSKVSVQGALTIGPGMYLCAWTGVATTAVLAGTRNGFDWGSIFSGSVSSGGALPASIAPVAVSPNVYMPWFCLY
jgi:hypothetical protein